MQLLLSRPLPLNATSVDSVEPGLPNSIPVPASSMHPHPSFEVPRCPHCGLIQFRHTIASCVRCKKPLDDFTGGMPARFFVPDRLEKSAELLALRVGVAVRSLRKERKFTQQRLAILMGTGRSYISKLESGRVVPSLQTLDRATSAFGIDLAELFLRLRRQTQADLLRQSSLP